VECDQPVCLATFSDPSALTRHRQGVHGALTRAEVHARRQVDIEEDTAARSANLVVCGWGLWNLRQRNAHLRLLCNHQVSVSVHAIDVPTDCMSPDITNQSKSKHQLVAGAQHHRQPTYGVSPQASCSRVARRNVANRQRLQVEGDLEATSALLDPQGHKFIDDRSSYHVAESASDCAFPSL
jgi:hypothetical protein